MTTQATSQTLILNALKRAEPLTADEQNAVEVMKAGVTGEQYAVADVDTLIAAVEALQTAYDGASALEDIDAEMTAASAAAAISTTPGGV